MTFEKLLASEQLIILQYMTAFLENDLVDDAEFQTRLGIDKEELRKVIALWGQRTDAATTSNAELAINNCLNEICCGIDVDDDTLQNRYNISRHTAKRIYNKLKITGIM